MERRNRILIGGLGLIIGLILLAVLWILKSPATSAPTPQKTSQPLTIISAEREPDTERLAAMLNCLPAQLTIQNQDIEDRVNRAWTELKNEQLERMLDLLDEPTLTDAEAQFEACLQAQGIQPQRLLSNQAEFLDE
ncbi:MAG: hypothetical protein AAGG02_11275 [Cyanobacteria bacterium P01_H01_bin.15]